MTMRRWRRLVAIPVGVALLMGVGPLAAQAATARRPARVKVVRKPAVRPTVKVVTPPAPKLTPQAPSGFSDGFDQLAEHRTFADGQLAGAWKVGFAGYGTVRAERDGRPSLGLKPMASTRPSETHAALVHTAQTFGDLDLRMRIKTVAQLRTGSAPNPWETAWVLWHYTGNTRFYYLVLKPNGWELGKEDPAYPGAQRFLATGSDVTFPVGNWHDIHVVQTGATIKVTVDDRLLVTFVDTERPYLNGSVALYNEDAHTRFADIRVIPV
jgi:hypothetical protein